MLSKQWHLFLSHKQQGADGYAALTKERLGRRGLKCWVDTAERCDRAGMEAGIKGSEAVLIFLFKGTLDRPYCRFEMRLARAYGVPVIVILEADSYRDTYVSIFDVIGHFDSGALPLDLKCVTETADFNFFYRRQEHEVDGMLNRLCEKLRMSQAEGEWPLNRQQKCEAAIKAEVSEAYRLLDVEVERQNAREAEAAEVLTSPQGQLMFTDTDGDTNTLKPVEQHHTNSTIRDKASDMLRASNTLQRPMHYGDASDIGLINQPPLRACDGSNDELSDAATPSIAAVLGPDTSNATQVTNSPEPFKEGCKDQPPCTLQPRPPQGCPSRRRSRRNMQVLTGFHCLIITI